MTTPIEFTRSLIKGKIAETIFEQMIREMGKYTVIPFGYEHTVPTLAQYQHITQVNEVMKKIKDAPDFALVSEDKSKIYLVEVKYQRSLSNDFVYEHAKNLLDRWNPSWLFVATPEGFHCAPCSKIVENRGQISHLSHNWADQKTQEEYLNLLNVFEGNGTEV